MKNGIDGPEASKGAGGLPWNGNREPRTEPRKPFMEDRKSSVNDSDWEAFGSDFSETPIIETPMGTVRPTGMRWRLNRDRREGRVGNVIPPGERTVENGDMGPRSAKKTFPEGPERPENGSDEFAAGRVEEQIVRTLMENLRASERRPGSPWNERNGHDVTSPAWFRVVDTEREAGLSEDSTTQTPAEDLSLGKNRKSTISAAFKSMVEKFLPDIRQITHPAARTDLGHHESLSSRHEAQATNQNITEADDLHSITTLTLLTEDVRALASFYTAVLGAALAPSTSATSSCITLAFTPQLAVRILNSGVARDHAIFGDYVTLGRQAATPKRVMLGVEVHDVDAVWRRLRDLGHGQKEDDGQETLGDVTTVGGRRSVCFVDLAGHCWEVWQRWEEVRDGQ
ncbi:hypothetical protein N0V82_000432 [Gnomoniopsis sp. IMI 355080]|nr:hypothetical protein N0V82_000432 [Gnomoniopsis sp. IMI 355080]